MDQNGAINEVRSVDESQAFIQHPPQVLAPSVRTDACSYAPIPPPPSLL
jgi:hypothetical protein